MTTGGFAPQAALLLGAARWQAIVTEVGGARHIMSMPVASDHSVTATLGVADNSPRNTKGGTTELAPGDDGVSGVNSSG